MSGSDLIIGVILTVLAVALEWTRRQQASSQSKADIANLELKIKKEQEALNAEKNPDNVINDFLRK
jgi:hypothetical protein